MSHLHALLGSTSASGAGETFLWDKVQDFTLSSDATYMTFSGMNTTYSNYDAMWFRMHIKAGNYNAFDDMTVRVDSYSGANVYTHDSGFRNNNGGFNYGQGISNNYAKFSDVMPTHNFSNSYRFGVVDVFLVGPRTDSSYNGSDGGNSACALFIQGGNPGNVDYNSQNTTLPSQSVIGSLDLIQFGCGSSHGSGQFNAGCNVKVYGVTYGA